MLVNYLSLHSTESSLLIDFILIHIVRIKELYDKVPRLVKQFLIRALVIFVAWQLLYRLVLLPVRIPDQFLTNTTGYSTAKILSIFYKNVAVVNSPHIKERCSYVLMNGERIVSIADPCNALEIYVLYIAFLFCFPGEWKRRLLFILIGIPYIYIINAIRCALIAWLNTSHKSLVDISHHYIFTTAVYLLVFYLWVLYTKKGIVNAA